MNKRYGIILILGVLIIHLFWGIGSIPLLDPDEPVYAETAREMIEYNDYLSPRIFNEYWYDKPPMYYWLVAGAQHIFGDNEFSARFPSALFGGLTLVSMFLGVKKIFDRDVAYWSVVILGTSIEFFYLAKAAVTDMTLLFFMTSAILAFLNKRYFLLYVFMGLATLTKGPIGLVFPGAIIFLYMLITSKWNLLKEMKLQYGVLIYVLIAVPWYYLMYQAHGQIFVDTFFGFHNITRFTTAEHPTRVLWWYYIPVLFVGLFPWTGALFSSLKASITDSTSNDMKKLLFINVWWVFVFLFFSVAKTKLVSYIFPLFPPISILIAWNLSRLNGAYQNNKNIGLAICEFSIFTLLSGVWFYLGHIMPELFVVTTVLGVLNLLLGIGVVIAYIKFKDIKLVVNLHFAAGILTMLLVFSFILPSLEDRLSVKTVANYYLKQCNQTQNVYVDKFLRPGFMYYTHKPGVNFIPKTDELSTIINSDKKGYIIVRDLEIKKLNNQDQRKYKVFYEKDGIKILKLRL